MHNPGSTGNQVNPWDIQVNVPSTLRRDGLTILSPEHLPPVDAKVEYLATHPLVASIWLVCSLLSGLVILPLARQEFNAGFLSFTFVTSIIPAIWILVCRYLRKSSARKVRAIEQQINPGRRAERKRERRLH